MSYLTPKTVEYLSKHYDEMVTQYKEILERNKYNYPRASIELQKLHPRIKLTSYAIGEFITMADLEPFQLKKQIEPYKQINRYFNSLDAEVLQFMNETLVRSPYKSISVADLWKAYQKWAMQEMGSVYTGYREFLQSIMSIIGNKKYDAKLDRKSQRWAVMNAYFKIFNE